MKKIQKQSLHELDMFLNGDLNNFEINFEKNIIDTLSILQNFSGKLIIYLVYKYLITVKYMIEHKSCLGS